MFVPVQTGAPVPFRVVEVNDPEVVKTNLVIELRKGVF